MAGVKEVCVEVVDDVIEGRQLEASLREYAHEWVYDAKERVQDPYRKAELVSDKQREVGPAYGSEGNYSVSGSKFCGINQIICRFVTK